MPLFPPPMLEVKGLIVAVVKCFGEVTLRLVKSLGPFWDGSVFHLVRLLTHRPCVPLLPPIDPVRAYNECPIITFSFTALRGRGVLASATRRFATPHLVGNLLASPNGCG
jgi:hypothetical protein